MVSGGGIFLIRAIVKLMQAGVERWSGSSEGEAV